MKRGNETILLVLSKFKCGSFIWHGEFESTFYDNILPIKVTLRSDGWKRWIAA